MAEDDDVAAWEYGWYRGVGERTWKRLRSPDSALLVTWDEKQDLPIIPGRCWYNCAAWVGYRESFNTYKAREDNFSKGLRLTGEEHHVMLRILG